MTLDEFVKKYNGKKVDFDGCFGAQCVDLARQYIKDVLEVPNPEPVVGAKDFYINHERRPIQKKYFDRIPIRKARLQKGDLIIWGTGKYGHIAIALDDHFTVFEQDGYDQELGARITHRDMSHTILGVLRYARN